MQHRFFLSITVMLFMCYGLYAEESSENVVDLIDQVPEAILNQLEENAKQYADMIGESDSAKVKIYYDGLEMIAPKLEEKFGLQNVSIKESLSFPSFNFDDPYSVINDPLFAQRQLELIEQNGDRIWTTSCEEAGEGFADCVAVWTSNGIANPSWCCTGTLIAPNVVLTAGHCCVDLNNGCPTRIYVGSDTNKDEPTKKYEVLNKYRHSDYTQTNDPYRKDDLTVLVLKEDVRNIKHRKLASTGQIDAAKHVMLMGYGKSKCQRSGVRLYGITPIARNICTPQDVQYFGCRPDYEMVCGQKDGVDTCGGDSGGPAYISVGGEWLLAGATSRATKNRTRECGDGGVYVRVDKYVDWIKSLPGVHIPE